MSSEYPQTEQEPSKPASDEGERRRQHEMITLFLDTNIYLHAKPIADIPWKDLLGEDVTIRIARITVHELDEQKDTNTKQRTRDRARKTLKHIETWITPTTLRPGVTIHYLHDEPTDLPHGLRRDRNDDFLIATILHYQQQHPDEHLMLITNDTGPRLTAKHHSLHAQALDEQHLLAPTPDPVAEENKRLKQQLHELVSASPELQLALNGVTKEITPQLLTLPPVPLDEDVINATAVAARARLPTFEPTNDPEPESTMRRVNGKLVLDLSKHQHIEWNPNRISSHEYTRYAAACATYEDDYRQYVRAHHETQHVRARTIKIDATLHNKGGKPAEDIDIRITFPQHVTISTNPPRTAGPPQQPMPPRSTGELLGESVQRGLRLDTYAPNFMPNINPAKRGPWIDGQTISWWVRTLNHGFERGLDTVYLTIDGKLQPFGASIAIHAANSVKPFTQTLLIKPIEHGPGES